MLIIDLLLGTILYAALEVIWLLIFEFFAESFIQPFRKQENAHPIRAFSGIILLGLIIGIVLCYIFPYRIIHIPTIPGISLLLSPLITGFVMSKIGKILENHGRGISYIATFWGGATFSFTISLIRFICIG